MGDQDVDEPLARSGQRPGQAAPSPGPVRPRNRARPWLALAAAVIVVVGIAVVVRMAASSGNGHPSGPAAGPSTTGHSGKIRRYAGESPWHDPVLDETHPNVVYIFADTNGGIASWGVYCQSSPVARIVSQTASAVTIAVSEYAVLLPTTYPGATGGFCLAGGLPSAQLTVTLAKPLDARALIDAKDGAARHVLDPATVLKPRHLPAGYTGGQATWFADRPGTAARRYQGPGGSLEVTIGPASLNKPMAHVIEHTTVRGHPATVSNDRGFEQDIRIAWDEDAAHAVTVYQMSYYEKAHPPLTADQLLRIANSLR